MFKKIVLIIALTLFASIPLGNAQNNESGLCLTVKAEAQRICRSCQSNIDEPKEINPMLSSYFTQQKYDCKKIIPLSLGNTEDFFFDEINCINLKKTVCTQTQSTGTERPILLKASNSEFFNVTDPNTGLLANPRQGQSFQDAAADQGPILGPILLIINFLTGIIATLAILALVIGSFFMISARGEESQITRGKDIIKNSLIALVIVLTSYTLIRTIQATVILILQ